ncbi:MAG: 2-succinylbenzoate--CoA ligase [Verrucomicrobiae bacterium]|nr:2-succinylbenzoate--CoA ligase [Verrucomicrobiae bacterium]
MLLTDLLIQNARELPDKVALAMRVGYRTNTLTYREVYRRAAGIAGYLRQQGVGKGDRVMVVAPNSPDWICLFWGVLLNGSVIVPLNLQSTPDMVQQISSQSGAKLFFRHHGFKTSLPATELESVRELRVDDVADVAANEDDLVEIMYTSGTTGKPKGVMLTHRNLRSNVEAVAEAMPMAGDDVFLSILPLSHVFEQTIGFLYPFRVTAKIVYAHSPAAIAELVREHRVTTIPAVPEFLRVLLAKIEDRAAAAGKKAAFDQLMQWGMKTESRSVRRLLFSSLHRRFGGRLRRVASGGAPLDADLEHRWNAMGLFVLQGYGLTETAPVISTNTEFAHRFRSVGKLLSCVEARIAGDGEIQVRGPSVFQGYFAEPELTKAAFTEDGWFKTGDIGEFDKDGFLFLKGRKKYMILGPGGQNVYPEDLEAALNKQTGMRDSCVVGWERKPGQEEIHAVLLGTNLNAEAVVAAANEHLATYQRITGFSVWPHDDFPRSATRKVKREEVIKWLKSQGQDTTAGKPEARQISPLIRLIASIADVDPAEINEKTDIFRQLPFDSLLRVELMAGIEQNFGVQLDEATLGPSLTVAKLAELIKSAPAAAAVASLKEWPRKSWAHVLREIGQLGLAFPIGHVWMDLKVEGAENVRKTELPAVFMANHLSFFDALAFLLALPAELRQRISFAAARDVVYGEFRYLAWLAELVFNCFAFPRKEGENIKAGLDSMGRLLDRGYSVMIFPEGQISVTGEFQPLKRGTGLVAVDMKAPIIPVRIIGTDKVLPLGKFIPRRGPVTVRFGKPMRFTGESHENATTMVEQALRTL